MKKWKKPFIKLASKVKNPFRKLKLGIKQQLGWLGVPQILPYRGFGNESIVYFRGCVLEDKGLCTPEVQDSIWDNMLAMFKRFKSDEIPGVKLQVTFMGQQKEVVTDEKGFFETSFVPENISENHEAWQYVDVELMEDVIPNQQEITARGQVMLLTRESQYGVISDVDDTILISKATNALKKFRLMLFKNAHSRLPFEGVAAFYRALQKGVTGQFYNPIFYVSSSEWNLYDLLVDFCFVRGIPKGPFLLQTLEEDWYKFWKSGGGTHTHKIDKIRHILTTYHDLRFILIGDSGQKDAEIYSKIVKEFPRRIAAIYIRDVSKEKRDKEINLISEGLEETGVEMLLVKDTEEAAKHAIAKNFISADTLKEIHEERDRDHNEPRDLAKVFSEKIGSERATTFSTNCES